MTEPVIWAYKQKEALSIQGQFVMFSLCKLEELGMYYLAASPNRSTENYLFQISMCYSYKLPFLGWAFFFQFS